MKPDPEVPQVRRLRPGRRDDFVPSESTLRTGYFRVEPTRVMRAEGYEWEHQVRVAVPASYAQSNRTYPVLWLTDNALELALSVLGNAELILVDVGPGLVSSREFSRRRCYDFYPLEDAVPGGPAGDFLNREYADSHPEGGGAARFLDFLIDEVRPALAAVYRMDPDDHGLAGFSAGGAFVAYAVFGRPGGFAKYLCGSPALYTGNNVIFDMEERYAAEHNDLPGHIYFGAGGGEVTEHLISAFGCVSSMARMAEILSFRRYPSLKLTVQIAPSETHGTMFPLVLSSGARSVWGDKLHA